MHFCLDERIISFQCSICKENSGLSVNAQHQRGYQYFKHILCHQQKEMSQPMRHNLGGHSHRQGTAKALRYSPGEHQREHAGRVEDTLSPTDTSREREER